MLAANSKYSVLFKYSFCQALLNRQYVIGKSILYVVATLIFINLWEVILVEHNSITPFSFNFIAWYIAINELVVLGNAEIYSRISMDIQSGNIAYHLNKPVSYLSMAIVEGLGSTIAMLFILGSIAVAFSYFYGIASPNIINIMMACASVIMASVVLLLIQALIGFLSYWMGDTFTLVLIMQKVMFVFGGLFVPLTVYPSWLQIIAKYTPFPYMLSHTASIAYSNSYGSIFFTLATLLLWIGIIFIAVLFSFRKLTRQLEIYGG